MIKNEEDAENYFVGGVASAMFLGIGVGIMLGVVISEELADSNWVLLGGLIFGIISYVVFFVLIGKFRKAGYGLKAIKKED